VVVPLYNKEKEIKNTLESVLNQSYPSDEIIVVDDGSIDKSQEIVKQFKNVKLIIQQNQGVSVARNRGISEAKNEYICFLDADDLWEEDFLKEIKSLIEKYPDAIFYSTSHKMIDEKGEFIYPKIPKQEGIINNFFEVFSNNYGLINSSSVCIKKSVNPTFPIEEKKGEDICLWMELALKGKLAFSKKALSIYKLNASNRSGEIHKEYPIPCQLKWIYQNRDRVTKDIKKFVYKNILITTYGNNKKFAKNIIEYMKKEKDYFYLLMYLRFFLPTNFLEIVKNIRRKFR